MTYQSSYLLDRNRPMTNEEIEKGYQLWKYRLGFCDLDAKLECVLKINTPQFETGWLNCMRISLQVSYESIANKLNLKRNNIKTFEANELNGSISLGKMKEIAEAMDCEFIYAIRPKCKTPISKIIWSQVLPEALNHPWLRACDQNRRHIALISAANFTLNNQKFRKSKGWTIRKFEQDKSYTMLNPPSRGRRFTI